MFTTAWAVCMHLSCPALQVLLEIESSGLDHVCGTETRLSPADWAIGQRLLGPQGGWAQQISRTKPAVKLVTEISCPRDLTSTTAICARCCSGEAPLRWPALARAVAIRLLLDKVPQ